MGEASCHELADDEEQSRDRRRDQFARDGGRSRLVRVAVLVHCRQRVERVTLLAFSTTASAIAARFSFKRAASAASPVAMICAARMPALRAPPIATVATGIPGGICTMAWSASVPCIAPDASGTPITGRVV